jgi:segregation and condensation protein A
MLPVLSSGARRCRGGESVISVNEAASNPPGVNTSAQSGDALPRSQGQDAAVKSPLDVNIEQFAGPLDLLLHLIRSQKINIYDIPIARITSQYLEFIRRAEELNIDLGGEFVFMAATLIHIKSRMLLPADPTLPEGEEEDPRQELVLQLIEHEKFNQAAHMLREKRVIEENVWSHPQLANFVEDEDDPGLAVSIFDLVKTFEQVLDRAKNRPTYEITAEDVSVASRIEYLKNMLLTQDGPLILREVFERQPSRVALIATFLAVLELVRMHAIVLRQRELFEDIVIRKHKMFDTVFSRETDWYAAAEEYEQ